MTRRAEIRLDGKRAGVLEELPEGSRFVYDDAYLELQGAQPVALTLPLRREPFESRALNPFFANLLPEGWLLELSSASHKISKDDAFGLLLASCKDCAGAVEVLPIEG
ncbi:MAG: HipA N-terminal domain-containing protein [Candidatus Sericytochromatia bacterium]|nr:HipA N-terminal domain-containing protein [Candidatus Tanganyikabacteria bacterium]